MDSETNNRDEPDIVEEERHHLARSRRSKEYRYSSYCITVKRNVKLVGNRIGHDDFVANVLEGTSMGKRPRGRPRRSYIDGIGQRMGFARLHTNT